MVMLSILIKVVYAVAVVIDGDCDNVVVVRVVGGGYCMVVVVAAAAVAVVVTVAVVTGHLPLTQYSPSPV